MQLLQNFHLNSQLVKMGFSSALQGRAAHEALIVRQDAELRLMEIMKRTMQLKAKYDKEYAIGLAAVAQQGLKIDRADEMQGNLEIFIFKNEFQF